MSAEMYKALADEYRAQLNAVTSRLVQQRRRIRQLEAIVADHAAHYESKFERIGASVARTQAAWRTEKARADALEEELRKVAA